MKTIFIPKIVNIDESKRNSFLFTDTYGIHSVLYLFDFSTVYNSTIYVHCRHHQHQLHSRSFIIIIMYICLFSWCRECSVPWKLKVRDTCITLHVIIICISIVYRLHAYGLCWWCYFCITWEINDWFESSWVLKIANLFPNQKSSSLCMVSRNTHKNEFQFHFLPSDILKPLLI